MFNATTSTPHNESCLLCRKLLGEVGLRVINGETLCEEDAANVITYGLVGAACKRQMDLALHAIAHRDTNVNGLYEELTTLFEKYGLIELTE